MDSSIDISKYDNLLVYKKGYSPEFIKSTIVKMRLNGLEVFGGVECIESVGFLNDSAFSFLDGLHVSCLENEDFSFLYLLKELRLLALGPSLNENTIIDLSKQINLKELSVHWHKGKTKGLENCKNLKTLCLIDFKETNLDSICKLSQLKKLTIKTSTIKTVKGLALLEHLESIALGNCRGLSSIKEINGKKKLVTLKIEACGRIIDYESLTDLPRLENLEIDCKKINSIKFIKNFPSLKNLKLRTEILDSDLKPAQNIKNIIYKPFKHYNIKIENKGHDILVKQNQEKIKEIIKRQNGSKKD